MIEQSILRSLFEYPDGAMISVIEPEVENALTSLRSQDMVYTAACRIGENVFDDIWWVVLTPHGRQQIEKERDNAYADNHLC